MALFSIGRKSKIRRLLEQVTDTPPPKKQTREVFETEPGWSREAKKTNLVIGNKGRRSEKKVLEN